MSHAEPEIVITEQPAAKGYRYRYKCEGKTAGTVPGERSTPRRKTVPAFRVNNVAADRAITVVISCVTADEPYRPHPHKLVGKDCDRGVCTMRLKKTNSASLQGIGIQCVKKMEIPESLRQREEINVDPFKGGYYEDDLTYNVKQVRFAIQGFVESGPKDNLVFTEIPPVVTSIIHDCKTDTALSISRIDKTCSPANGGEQIFLLCEKVNKDDIAVQFYEEDPHTDQIEWEALADFSPNDVHKQFAIVFSTPGYRDPDINAPRKVWMRLFRPSDQGTSEPKSFTYMPVDTDPHGVNRKRKKGFKDEKPVGICETPMGMLPVMLQNQGSRVTKPAARRLNDSTRTPTVAQQPVSSELKIETISMPSTPNLDELMPTATNLTHKPLLSNTQIPDVVNQFNTTQPTASSFPAVVQQSSQNNIVTQPTDDGHHSAQYILNSITCDDQAALDVNMQSSENSIMSDDLLLDYLNGSLSVSYPISEDNMAALAIGGSHDLLSLGDSYTDMSKIQTDSGGGVKTDSGGGVNKRGRPRKVPRKSPDRIT